MKKIMVIIAVIAILFNTCAIATADTVPPSIVVDGGAVAGGGVAAGVNSESDVAAVIAVLALASQGLNIQVSGNSGSKLDFIKDLLSDYADLIGMTFSELCNLWVSNVRVLANGALEIGQNNSLAIYRFLSYLKNSDLISGGGSDVEYVVINGVRCPVVKPSEFIDLFVDRHGSQYSLLNGSSDIKYVLFWSDDFTNKTQYMVSNVNQFIYKDYDGGRPISGIMNNYQGDSANGLYYRRSANNSDVVFDIPYVPNGRNSILALNGTLNFKSDLPDNDSIIGDTEDVNPSDFEPSSGNVNVINSGLNLSDIANASGMNGIVTIKNYIKALIDALNGVEDQVIKVNNTVTGLLEDLPISNYNPYESASVTQEDPNNISSGTEIINENLYPDAETTQNYLNNMTFDLTGIFPFCIPFDVYNLLAKLDVQPVTPHVHLSFNIPVFNEPLVFDLDFSQWNGVASVVRHMELFAFVIGLALITRHLLRG